jgi:hypothetical protein
MASRVECALTSTSDCLILAAKQAFTREVADGRPGRAEERHAWNWGVAPVFRPFRGRRPLLRVLPPPGPPPRPSKAEREQEERAEARVERLHLPGLTNTAVIIMGGVLGAVVVMLVLVVMSHHYSKGSA